MAEPGAIVGQEGRDRVAADAHARAVAFHDAFGDELRRFVRGVVRDAALADDVVQAALLKAVELGHTARPETFKSWVFQVAYREALAARRRDASRDRGRLRLAGLRSNDATPPADPLVRDETAREVRSVLDALPPEQRQVVQARIYDEKTFREIADESGLPLGTVLTRMRRALEKMRRSLSPEVHADADDHQP